MRRVRFVFGLLILAILSFAAGSSAADRSIELTLRRRDPATGEVVTKVEKIDLGKLAIVVVDMWDNHWCKTLARRTAELVPHMNQTLRAARKLGIPVVFAPSDVLASYRDHPARKAMQAIPQHPRPKPNDFNPPRPPWGRTGGCECGPERPCKSHRAWKSQHPELVIEGGDLIGDCNNSQELVNFCKQRGITHLIYMGVHTNMCVCYRGFGMVSMKRLGLEPILVRDLTDAAAGNGFDPDTGKANPALVLGKGTDAVVAHIETHIAATIASTALSGKPQFRFPADNRPHVVVVIGEDHMYGATETMPRLATELEAHYGMRCTVLRALSRTEIPGLEALDDADLAIFYIRRRLIPPEQMQYVRRYMKTDKPLLAFRTTSHAFQPYDRNPPKDKARWDAFDREVLGCHYAGHTAGETQVRAVPEAAGHPILKGFQGPHQLRETLYRSLPLADSCKVLLVGKCVEAKGNEGRSGQRPGHDEPEQPVAWINTRGGNGKVFYTSMGHHPSFEKPWFRRLVLNAVFWLLERPLPAEAARR